MLLYQFPPTRFKLIETPLAAVSAEEVPVIPVTAFFIDPFAGKVIAVTGAEVSYAKEDSVNVVCVFPAESPALT